MGSWRCGRCGFIHIGDRLAAKVPTECPSCGSTKLVILSADTNLSPSIQTLSADQGNTEPNRLILELLERLPAGSLEEQETGRKSLALRGIYVLSMSERVGSLKETLSAREAGKYLTLVEREGYGLAVVNGMILAVSSDSPLRVHFGVSYPKLTELREAATRDD